MKNLALLFIAAFFIQLTGNSQTSCLPEGIAFTTQAQIDSFQINYPDCIEIEGNVDIFGDDITDLSSLNNIVQLNGWLNIGGNEFLSNLTGLDNLVLIGGPFMIDNNPSLNSLTGLNSLTYIGGNFDIWDNDILASLEGLESLTFTGENMSINNNPLLSSLTGIYSLTIVEESFEIYHNDELESFTGLENLILVGGNLDIRGNHSLSSLSGLESLTSIGNKLMIGHTNWRPNGNPALTNILSLNNLTFIGAGIYIEANESLSSCEAAGICDFLFDPNGEILIYYNADGCNSPEEVIDACWGVSTEELLFENSLIITPNPFSSNCHIEYTLYHNSPITFQIYDISGQVIEILVDEPKQKGEHKLIYNGSNLKSGIYFCTFQTNEKIQTIKMIKL